MQQRGRCSLRSVGFLRYGVRIVLPKPIRVRPGRAIIKMDAARALGEPFFTLSRTE